MKSFPKYKADPSSDVDNFLNGLDHGISLPDVQPGQTIPFNIARYDRSNDLHKSLEDADTIEGTQLSIMLLTATDPNNTAIADLTKATARGFYGNLQQAVPGDLDCGRKADAGSDRWRGEVHAGYRPSIETKPKEGKENGTMGAD